MKKFFLDIYSKYSGKPKIFLWVFAFIFVVLASIFVVFNASKNPARAGTINVPDDYLTIQEAIDAASSGDVISVSAGTYDGDLQINKSLTLQGAGYASTIIRGLPDGSLSTIDAIAPSIIIDGFTIDQTPHSTIDADANNTAINAQNVGYLSLDNCKLTNHITGVSLSSVPSGLIQNNIFASLGNGILFEAGSNYSGVIVRLNQFMVNALGISPNSAAIKVAGDILGTTPLINRNYFIGNISLATGGVTNQSSTMLDVTRNWWGTAVKTNIQTGVSGNVSFTPYYIDAGMTVLSDLKAITAFAIPSQLGETIINEDAHTIVVTMPSGTTAHAITELVPTITFTGTLVNPASVAVTDFTVSQIYTVNAVDETTQDYAVTVVIHPTASPSSGGSYSPAASSTKAITGFSVPGQLGETVINEAIHTIVVTMPFGTTAKAITELVPTITFTGVLVSPASAISSNFTISQIFTVTAADGTTQNYTVTAVIALATQPKAESNWFLNVVNGSDIVRDGKIDSLDLDALLLNWGKIGADNPADINRDGSVDIFDFNLLMVNWGKIEPAA
ncbi:MAG: hypothetical protein PHU42_01825 [Patescibacteria group bacterium]|nr:hypothetical protein [Patescibacteria group bacterium]